MGWIIINTWLAKQAVLFHVGYILLPGYIRCYWTIFCYAALEGKLLVMFK
jgi:hypothetical protein